MSSAQQISLLPKTPLETLLDAIRSSSRSESEKGRTFEDLCIRYLQNEPQYRRLYQKIEHYNDWAAQHGQPYGLSVGDTGTDLVATTKSGELHAVQCKCYEADRVINKTDIDSFLSHSGNKAFSRRLLIDTTLKPLGSNADEAIANQHTPVFRINLQHLQESQIDWSQYQPQQPAAPLLDSAASGQAGVILKDKHQPREYQQKAIDDVLDGLKNAERGKLIMACGTGKTFTALKIAERQAGAGKNVLFLVPSPDIS